MNKDPDYCLYDIKIKKETKDLLRNLLEKNPKKRIKINEIKKLQFFQDIDFVKLINYECKAPFIPQLVKYIFLINKILFRVD